MLTYLKSNEYRYFRDVSIVWLTRNSNLPLQQVLQKKLSEFDELNKFFTNDLLTTYLSLREELFTDEPWLFATDDGHLYQPGKFSQNIQRMLVKVGLPAKPNHPNKMNQAQVEALLSLRFSIERPGYQQTLAGALLGLQAMRPEEVAALRIKDIDLDEQTILLRETKSQKSQIAPIHPDLVKPLTTYLAHLKSNEVLFIHASGTQWNRKDVHQAVGNIADQCGLEHINPRRLRSTVGHEMMRGGIPLNEVSLILRHSDEATTARHYLHLEEIDDARGVLNRYYPVANELG
jgi:integrase